jgi:hypothetical protein
MSGFTLRDNALMRRLQGRIGLMAATPILYEIRSQIKGEPDITFHHNGNIASKKWKNNGKLHRVVGPAEINYDYNGEKINASWYKQGKRNRVNDAALITFGPDQKPMKKVWYTNGKKNKEYFYNGYNDLTKQRWFNGKGKIHRDTLPAEISYRYNEVKDTMEIEEQIYYDNGKFKQRSNGKPNMIINDGFGSIDEYTLNPNGQTISLRRDGVFLQTMFGITARRCGRKQRKRVNKRGK